jgi:hypothetical protein
MCHILPIDTPIITALDGHKMFLCLLKIEQPDCMVVLNMRPSHRRANCCHPGEIRLINKIYNEEEEEEEKAFSELVYANI